MWLLAQTVKACWIVPADADSVFSLTCAHSLQASNLAFTACYRFHLNGSEKKHFFKERLYKVIKMRTLSLSL